MNALNPLVPLSGQTAFISGSTAGIGFAIAQALLADGASVHINGRRPEAVQVALSRLLQQFPAAQVLGVTADLGNAAGGRRRGAHADLTDH